MQESMLCYLCFDVEIAEANKTQYYVVSLYCTDLTWNTQMTRSLIII